MRWRVTSFVEAASGVEPMFFRDVDANSAAEACVVFTSRYPHLLGSKRVRIEAVVAPEQPPETR